MNYIYTATPAFTYTYAYSNPTPPPVVATTKKTVLEYYDYYIKRERAAVDKKNKKKKQKDTIRTYETRKRKLTEYLTITNQLDLIPETITVTWIRDYDSYLSAAGLSINYIAKNLQLLNKSLECARESRDIQINPFDFYTLEYDRDYDQTVISLEELLVLAAYKFKSKKLQRVAHAFVFSCLTGLAYTDARNFEESLHVHKVEGRKVIIQQRHKGGAGEAIIPYFKEAEKIVTLYGGRLSMPCNMLLNRYIKECFEIAGINKIVTHHTARRTFGDIMHNDYGISIEVVSKMMGHKDIRVTQQYYVKTRARRVLADVAFQEFFKIKNAA